MGIEKTIQTIIEENECLSGEELSKKLGKKYSQKEIKDALSLLIKEKDILKTKKGKYASLVSKGYYKGSLEVKRGGFGFVRAEGGDIFIPSRDMKGALNGDIVLVKKKKEQRGEKRTEGKVEKICSKEAYVTAGTFVREKNSAFVLCDDPTLADVYIPKKDNKNAKNNQKVLIEITKRAEGKLSAEGKVIEILGNKGDPGVDILSIARTFHLREEFPENVAAEARKLTKAVTQDELKSREILFNKKIITIDGADSKDLDDAISIEKLKNGNWVLGVHIADVSHYVREKSALDKEALHRGTSVYLIDRVIPMLPRELSNGICSLLPNEVRLTLSCFMEIDRRGRVVSHRIVNSAIISRFRMTYHDVNSILEEDDPILIRKYADIYSDLKEMESLAEVLRDVRFKKGSIDFDIEEGKIVLDEMGKPISIGIRERRTAEKLIEEFMITCNNTIAEEYFLAELPFLYRIHEAPDGEKMRELRIFLQNFGIRMRGVQNGIRSKDIQRILEECKGEESENIINRVTLRSLQKAKYSPENLGHFGLASHAYCHFTSPIRRYPDLLIHRIIKENLAGMMSAKRIAKLEKELPEIASKTSERERNAIDAERKVDDIKKAEYINAHIGERFEGIVSGVTPSAIFVELPNTVEGVIPLSECKNDYYTYHKELYCVIGERTKRKISLGDSVKIQVKDVDIDTARVEFSLLLGVQKKKKV